MNYVLLVGLLASWLVLAICLVAVYQLILQSGRTLLRLEALEQGSDESDEYEIDEYLGMRPIGYPAPAIDLPDLSGAERSLAEWRGQRVLLVFVDPGCLFSKRLLPYLDALTSDPVPGRPAPLLVSTGEVEANRALFDDAGYSLPVLLQREMEVATAYEVDGTPSSYLIAPDGTIASRLASGVQATLILAGEIESVNDATATEHIDDTQPVSSSAPSRPGVLRDGLKVGTTAPVFRLPRLEGGEVSLLEYRGRPLILVFTDPECEPCAALAPQLKEQQRDLQSTALLLISRGGVEANQAMVTEQGLTMSIALQRHWEISRDYGIFAVPAAFYIDEWGVIAEEVAAGTEAIVDLVSRVARQEAREP